MDPIPSSPAHAPAPSNSQVNGAPIYKRKPKSADPLFGPKRKIQHRPLSNPRTNGQVPPRLQPLPVPSPRSQRSLSPSKSASIPEERISGFSDPGLAPGSFRDYRLVTTKKDLLEGLRFHLLQFSGDKPVDIRDEHEFVRPVRLHRRDPRAGATNQAKAAVDDPKDGLDAAEREELNKRKEQRQKEREENLKQIAPSTAGAKKGLAFKKKTAQVWRPDYSLDDRKRIQTNYEEKLPWHLEDFENKHCFVGAHQSGSTNAHAAFVYEADPHTGQGRLRLLPVEKLYHFKPKQDKVKVLTLEEAEKAMRKHSKLPEVLERAMRERQEQFIRDKEARRVHGVSTGIQRETLAGRQGEEADFDFDEDFADDEEGDLFQDKDEDAKIAEKRIKEDQLKANLFNMKEEKEYDLEELIEKREEEARKTVGKRMNKKLERREKNYNHGSDSEDSYGSSTDTEEERERLEAEKKALAERLEIDQRRSGISSTGTNTPSGRKEKHGGGIDSDRDMKRTASSKSLLKRPGSPNLSDASGTDASTARRKKNKHRHLSVSNQPTPQPSRPVSPANNEAPPPPSSSAPARPMSTTSLDPSAPKGIKKRKSIAPPGSAAGSDTEAAAYSDGGVMSDGSKAKRLKLNLGAPMPLPAINANMRGSDTTAAPASGSRSGTPRPQPVPSAPAGPAANFPTADEIASVIPPGGIRMDALVALFKGRGVGKNNQTEFIALMKSVARLDKATKLIVRK